MNKGCDDLIFLSPYHRGSISPRLFETSNPEVTVPIVNVSVYYETCTNDFSWLAQTGG